MVLIKSNIKAYKKSSKDFTEKDAVDILSDFYSMYLRKCNKVEYEKPMLGLEYGNIATAFRMAIDSLDKE